MLHAGMTLKRLTKSVIQDIVKAFSGEVRTCHIY